MNRQIKSVKALKEIKSTLNEIGIHQLPFIQESDFLFMHSSENLDIHLDTIGFKNKYIIRVEQIRVINENQKGIGSMIMYIINTITQDNGVTVGLWTDKDNKIAINWYKRQGYKKTNHKAKKGNGTDIWWEKSPNKTTDYFDEKIPKEIKEMIDLKIKLAKIKITAGDIK